MRKLVILLLTTIMLISCHDEANRVETNQRIPTVFYAQLEDGGANHETKVYADEAMRVLWNQDDRITIYNRYTYGDQYRFLGNDGDNAGAFEIVENGAFVTGNALDNVYAVYPYSEDTQITNDGVLIVRVPTEQTYKDHSFGPGANTMVSVTSDNNLLFRNVGGFLSFKLYGAGKKIKKVSLRGNNGESLAGWTEITMSVNGIPTTVCKGSTTITLNCPEPIELNAERENYTEFWVVVPPVTFSKGFTIIIKDSEGNTFEKSVNKSITINRNTISRMAPLEMVDEEHEWKSLGHFTFTGGWRTKPRSAEIKYYEENEVRTCVAECKEEGEDRNTTIRFRWYLKRENSNGYQLVEVPYQYYGYDYSDGKPKTEGQAVHPVFMGDSYHRRIERGESEAILGTWLEYAAMYGNIDGSNPLSYYDGEGGFYFNCLYELDLGRIPVKAYDLIALSDDYPDYSISIEKGQIENETIAITFSFMPPAVAKYTLVRGSFSGDELQYRLKKLEASQDETVQTLSSPAAINIPIPTNDTYTLMAITVDSHGKMKQSAYCYIN